MQVTPTDETVRFDQWALSFLGVTSQILLLWNNLILNSQRLSINSGRCIVVLTDTDSIDRFRVAVTRRLSHMHVEMLDRFRQVHLGMVMH